MISGLRSALLCDDVEQAAHGAVSYLGLHGDTVTADTRPGLVSVWVCLIVELDGQGATGHVRVRSADYDQTVPFKAPAGPRLTAVAFPVLITLLRRSALTVSVVDDAPRGRTLSTAWTLDFAPGAEMLEAGVGEQLLAASAEARDGMTAHLAAKSGRAH